MNKFLSKLVPMCCRHCDCVARCTTHKIHVVVVSCFSPRGGCRLLLQTAARYTFLVAAVWSKGQGRTFVYPLASTTYSSSFLAINAWQHCRLIFVVVGCYLSNIHNM